MISQAIIFFLIQLKLFFLVQALDATDPIGLSAILKIGTMNREEFLAMPHILGIDRVEIAFTKREIMYRIQQVCFSHPIISDEAIYFLGET
jgi:hypothetical protein